MSSSSLDRQSGGGVGMIVTWISDDTEFLVSNFVVTATLGRDGLLVGPGRRPAGRGSSRWWLPGAAEQLVRGEPTTLEGR